MIDRHDQREITFYIDIIGLLFIRNLGVEFVRPRRADDHKDDQQDQQHVDQWRDIDKWGGDLPGFVFAVHFLSPGKSSGAYTNGTYKTHKTHKSYSYAPRKFHSLNLKATCGGYRAEIDDRDRTDILIGLIEYPTLRHGGREFRLNRRVVRRHDVCNLRGPPIFANFRGQNHIFFTETRSDAHELVGRVERRGRRRGKQRGFEQ